MKRLGLAVVPQRGIPLEVYVQMAQLAERQGYESFWVGEANGLEVFTFLGIILSQTARLKVAPGIASLFTRPPTLMTMSVASLHAIAPRRTRIGNTKPLFRPAPPAVRPCRRPPLARGDGCGSRAQQQPAAAARGAAR